MSILSVISFYRQFGQLNHHLIIITKEQQKDKGTQIRFYWGPASCHANVPKGSVPSTRGFGRSMSTACAFQQDLCEIYTPKDNRLSHPKCTQSCQSRNWETVTGRG